MRLDFGNGALAPDGSTKPREALEKWEPRSTFLDIEVARKSDGQIESYRVNYQDREESVPRETTVTMPSG